MEYDVLIVGGGPAGLSAALRIRQRALACGSDISVAVVEKGAAIGAHALSGALLDPRAMDELLPDWRQQKPPLEGTVADEALWLLGPQRSFRLPGWSLPPIAHHRGHDIISLGRFTGWLAEQAEAAGIDIFTGFAAAQPLYDAQNGSLRGVITSDFGIARDGSRKPNYQPGIELHARYTLIAEGSRGHLTRQLEERFHLRDGIGPQKYGLGFRELWRIPAERHVPGRAWHTLGWPLSCQPQQYGGYVQGGGFIYHVSEQCVAIGLVVHLDYENPWLSPFDEFQRFKTHPLLRSLLDGGERLNYGARTLTEGGLQSLPKLAFPGGVLIGCAAGFVNLPRTQGIHTAIKSGLLAADAAVAALQKERQHDTLDDYTHSLRASWLYDELHAVRNVKPSLHTGFRRGIIASGAQLWAAQCGIGRWLPTLPHHQPDHQALQPADVAPKLSYPPCDQRLTFDRASSVYLSNTQHEEDQPCHLQLIDPEVPEQLNLPRYAGPEVRYCPAGVYEYRSTESDAHAPPTLRIHASNCLHCKACDLKDPSLNILWTPPEGGGGPHYGNM